MATVLHEDVLLLILANFCTGGRHDVLTLSRLALVSRQFHILVTPLLYRSLHLISLSGSQRRNLEVLMTRLTTKTEVFSFIREIDMGGIFPYGDLVVDWLKDLLPKLTLLNGFSWNPSEKAILPVVQLIRQLWPACRLYPKPFCIGSSEANELVETVPQMLQELRLFISQEPASGQKQKKALVHAIKHCPNVWSLEVRKSISGCVIYSPWMGPHVRLDLSEGDILPAPSEVSIMEPPFPWEDIGYWGNMGGWRNLEKLTLRDTSPLPFFGGCNSMLRSLSFIDGGRIDEVVLEEFCATLCCLEKLEIVGKFAKIPTNTLRNHGEALKQLDVYGYNLKALSDTETAIADYNRPGDIHDMDRWGPNISHLALDMFRDGGSWPYVFLSTLARFPKLTTLTLYVQDIPASPYLDTTAAEHIFNYLSSRKIGYVLRELNIHHVSTRVYGRQSVDPGHTVFTCIADPFTDEHIIKETNRFGSADISQSLHEHMTRRKREKDEDIRRRFHAHPPSVFLAELKAYNAFLQSIAPERPELHIVYRGYEIRTCNDPARLLLYEKEWMTGIAKCDTVLAMEVVEQSNFREQMQELLYRQDEEANEGPAWLGKALEKEMDRRFEEGWDLWEMEGVRPKPGSEGFLFDKLSARAQNTLHEAIRGVGNESKPIVAERLGAL